MRFSDAPDATRFTSAHDSRQQLKVDAKLQAKSDPAQLMNVRAKPYK